MEPKLERFQKDGIGDIRVVMRDSGYWFVAKDVAECIGHSDVGTMCEMCRPSDKYTVTKLEAGETLGSNKYVSSLVLVSEPGLYRILAKSRLPKCEPFEQWHQSFDKGLRVLIAMIFGMQNQLRIAA